MAKNEGGEAVIVSDWMTIDVSALNAESEDGLKGLSFQIISNFGNGGGLTMPNYIAIDNVNFNVPEPAEFAAIFGLAAIAAAFASKGFSSRK